MNNITERYIWLCIGRGSGCEKEKKSIIHLLGEMVLTQSIIEPVPKVTASELFCFSSLHLP